MTFPKVSDRIAEDVGRRFEWGLGQAFRNFRASGAIGQLSATRGRRPPSRAPGTARVSRASAAAISERRRLRKNGIERYASGSDPERIRQVHRPSVLVPGSRSRARGSGHGRGMSGTGNAQKGAFAVEGPGIPGLSGRNPPGGAPHNPLKSHKSAKECLRQAGGDEARPGRRRREVLY